MNKNFLALIAVKGTFTIYPEGEDQNVNIDTISGVVTVRLNADCIKVVDADTLCVFSNPSIDYIEGGFMPTKSFEDFVSHPDTTKQIIIIR